MSKKKGFVPTKPIIIKPEPKPEPIKKEDKEKKVKTQVGIRILDEGLVPPTLIKIPDTKEENEKKEGESSKK